MGIGVVADSSDHKTRKVIHQAGRFHLKADAILTEISNNLIAHSGLFNKCVARCDGPIVDTGVGRVTGIALNLVSSATVPTVGAGDVVA